MADKTLQALVNGGLILDIADDPNLLSIDTANMEEAGDPSGTFYLICTQDGAAPQNIALDNFLTNLPDGQVISESGDNALITLDGTGSQVEIGGELTAIANYSLSVAGTNADCFIDDAGRIAPSTSSREVKENIRDADDDDVARLLALRPRVYNRIGQQQEEIGLVAEEVAAIWPELTAMKNEELEPEILPNGRKKRRFQATNIPQGVNATRLVAPMLKLLQSQAAQIAEMKDRLDALET